MTNIDKLAIQLQDFLQQEVNYCDKTRTFFIMGTGDKPTRQLTIAEAKKIIKPQLTR